MKMKGARETVTFLTVLVLLVETSDGKLLPVARQRRSSWACQSSPCQNGGDCQESDGFVKCYCVEGFTGTRCESMILPPDPQSNCFTTNATVLLESGQRINIQDVSVGDQLLSFDRSGKLFFSEVAMWMDRVPQAKVDLIQVTTESGKSFKATPYHLVLVGDTFIQMRHLNIGDELLLADDGKQMHKEQVKSIYEISDGIGAYAPLTYEGTIVVDGVAASCYAHSHQLGQIAFAPMKLMRKLGITSGKTDGLHWYSKMLIDGVNACGMTKWLMP